jgi:hypothetical protein
MTKRLENGKASLLTGGVEKPDIQGSYDALVLISKALNKLCDYEDAEEANRDYNKLGKAVEKSFKQESCVLFIDYRPNTEECFEFELISTDELLEWAEGRE